jgi:hypothetical protein
MRRNLPGERPGCKVSRAAKSLRANGACTLRPVSPNSHHVRSVAPVARVSRYCGRNSIPDLTREEVAEGLAADKLVPVDVREPNETPVNPSGRCWHNSIPLREHRQRNRCATGPCIGRLLGRLAQDECPNAAYFRNTALIKDGSSSDRRTVLPPVKSRKHRDQKRAPREANRYHGEVHQRPVAPGDLLAHGCFYHMSRSRPLWYGKSSAPRSRSRLKAGAGAPAAMDSRGR